MVLTMKVFYNIFVSLVILIPVHSEVSGISPRNFTLMKSMASILNTLTLRSDTEQETDILHELPSVWRPILDDLNSMERDQKVMKQKPNNFIVNNNPMRPPPPPIGTDPDHQKVSETDMYLLGAIEKLVYRVDYMEKRLRRMEDLMYYVMSGTSTSDDPCPKNFTRAGKNCYHFSAREYNWKSSSSMCRSLGSNLAELESIEENQDVVTYIQAHSTLRGKDYWTGGLNPGLLWIWANSARPISSNSSSTDSTDIRGNGRCLKIAYNPATRSYAYQGTDCSTRIYYICEYEENSTTRALEGIQRALFQKKNEDL